MTIVIIAIMLLAYILIATEKLTKVNKAAVAVFAGTVGWILYICYGTDYVTRFHGAEYAEFLHGSAATSVAVKHFIADNIFLKYVGRAAEIVLFLLATMTIVEILNNYLKKFKNVAFIDIMKRIYNVEVDEANYYYYMSVVSLVDELVDECVYG